MKTHQTTQITHWIVAITCTFFLIHLYLVNNGVSYQDIVWKWKRYVATKDIPSEATPSFGYRISGSRMPRVSMQPYVRPEFARYMQRMQPVIKAAAARHNQPELSDMTDTQFAEVLALVLYNEHNGWVEDAIEPLRVLTPLYQQAQIIANQSGIGSNYSIWPTNVRPSVALEILRQQVPVPPPTTVITIPMTVHGSSIDLANYPDQSSLYAAITNELIDDALGIEYLAVNLQRGVYRARYEGVPVSWRVLAAWHNQGIVHPELFRANPCSREYIYRSSAYLPLAHDLIHTAPAADLGK